MNPDHEIQEGKFTVDGLDINCIQVGSGNHPVLLMPGLVVTPSVHFKPQIENLSREKFRIIAWDPPGYGKSRPPDRTFPEDFLERDAILACNLMTTLGHSIFSIIGMCHGGISAIILASIFPEKIRKMVIISGRAYFSPHEYIMKEGDRNVDLWPARDRDPMVATYGYDYFRKTWDAGIDMVEKLCEKNKGDVCKNHVPRVKCPTLIIHGKKDDLVDQEQAFYLNRHIPNSRLKIFENGGHKPQLQYPEEFNALITKFLTE
ncbi:valacyclovir hydrolase-like isoform X2 [Belonocnema kinseyi]|uniref:valacyclovir hydrolase-like isoform X2 n=1 Tax=Belonocnema kinseyi TaxID=2817044 RepID=UPI00143CF0F4|nr:valacyclovir hydrolase-like isoform X2 [Belonocnema kinseyi]